MSEWDTILDKLAHDSKDELSEAPDESDRGLSRRVNSNSAIDSELLIAATEAAMASDIAKESRERASEAKGRLKAMMIHKGIGAIAMPDRKDIRLKRTAQKLTTKKSLLDAMNNDKDKLEEVWNNLTVRENVSLNIPKKEVDEPSD